ncbi:hypothetical protein SNE40_010067 [Patella caerulea]|uniref:G-protein coupled receptors family 1 profile domain-containing protein n=1 Tax=Patella caerulea TaxID=87958 RepID=A0AAN8JZZ5_PATCE
MNNFSGVPDRDGQPKSMYLYLAAVDIVALAGLVGNIFLFFLMFRATLKHVSFSVYLVYLAVVQSIVLLQTSMEDTLDHGFNVLNQFMEPICRPWLQLSDTTRFASTWLVLALTLDRCIALFVTKYKAALCTRKVSHAVCIVTIAVCFALSLPGNVAPRINHDNSSVYNDDGDYVDSCPNDLLVYKFVTAGIFHTLVPVSICCILDIAILIQLKRVVLKIDVDPEDSQAVLSANQAVKVKRCLVALCCLAVLTLVPIAIVESIESFSSNETAVDNAGEAWRFFNIVLLVNYGQNFYIIMAMSLYMRCLFEQMICRDKARYKQQEELVMILSPNDNAFL